MRLLVTTHFPLYFWLSFHHLHWKTILRDNIQEGHVQSFMPLAPYDVHAVVFQRFSFSLTLQFKHFNSFTGIMFMFTIFLVHFLSSGSQDVSSRFFYFVKYLSFGSNFSEDLLMKTQYSEYVQVKEKVWKMHRIWNIVLAYKESDTTEWLNWTALNWIPVRLVRQLGFLMTWWGFSFLLLKSLSFHQRWCFNVSVFACFSLFFKSSLLNMSSISPISVHNQWIFIYAVV